MVVVVVAVVVVVPMVLEERGLAEYWGGRGGDGQRGWFESEIDKLRPRVGVSRFTIR